MSVIAYDFSVTHSGRMIETLSFTQPIYKGIGGAKRNCSPIREIVIPDDNEIAALHVLERDYRKERLYKAKREMERLSYCNFDNKYTSLITLTYRANMTDLDYANRDFSKFIQRLRYPLEKYKYPYPGFKLKYICKPELQDRGAVHYHFVCNLRAFPFAKKNVRDWRKQGTLPPSWDEEYNLQDIWKGKTAGKGTADLEQIEQGMISVVSYLTNYMTKGNDTETFAGRRSYFPSTNLERPVKKYGDEAREYLDELLQSRDIKEKNSWTFTPESFLEQEISCCKYFTN